MKRRISKAAMFMLRKNTNQRTQEVTEYATRSDFQEIFTEDMAGLHLLAFLLTADAKKAEQCFVAGLDESFRGNTVFRQWARSWSKRAIIKNAIKMISPAPRRIGLDVDAGPDEGEAGRIVSSSVGPGAARNESLWNEDAPGTVLIAAASRLDAFDRFVLVMTVLEDYSVRECAALLGCAAPQVAAAKARSLAKMGPPPATAQTEHGNATVSWASFLSPTQLA
jgi:DNA-directed RNA polymerase specialized sigma24 family protein